MDWKSIISALTDYGLTLQAIADHVGMSKGAVHDLKSGRGKTVVYETGVKIVDLDRAIKRRIKRLKTAKKGA